VASTVHHVVMAHRVTEHLDRARAVVVTAHANAPRRSRRREWSVTLGVVGSAAIAGNAFVGRDALAWFGELRRPRGVPTMPVFAFAGVAYYAALATILHRARRRGDQRTARCAAIVLIGNELWNVAFFQRRSTRNGFVGIVAFAAAVLALRHSTRSDPVSRRLVDAYLAWVVYDAWWTYRLWRLNP
jgi:tryptophan-rich sensory protein